MNRADGQRIEKVANASLTWFQASRTSGQYDLNFATSGASTRYFYDGQMGMEDDYNPSGSVTVVNRYGLGARGIDRVERTENSTTTYGYPLYDGHGNMRTTLGRNGTGYTTGTFKTYDVWGSVRSGGDSGDPTQKYCASLGHVSDADSGLIYMRARYYEPSTGRFVSEDPARDGLNWFVYCGNDPVTATDFSGKAASWSNAMVFGWFIYFVVNFLAGADNSRDWGRFGVALAIMTGLTVLHEKGYSEVFVRRFALWAHTAFFKDSGPNPWGESPYLRRSQVVQAFFLGYALALYCISALLDDWVADGPNG